mgnify:CR=1 FL=1
MRPFLEMFGGEERSFRVALAELRAIQSACDAGPAVVAERLARCVQVKRAHPQANIFELLALGLGDWRIEDVREPILQALIGGGLSPNAAGALVRRHIDDRGLKGLVENVELALVCIAAGVADDEDDPAMGESPAGAESPTSPAGN